METVLVVEDSRAMQRTLQRLLEADSLTVQIASDGITGLEYFRKQQPNAVLLDLKLPKIDGLEVLRRVKSDDRTKAIPVVVLTSSKEQKDVVESYQLGVNSYIVKPVNFDGFASAVQELGMYWLLLNQPPKIDG